MDNRVLTTEVTQGCGVFDGSTALVNCGNTPALALGTSDFTVELWFKSTRNDIHNSFISKDVGAPTVNGWLLTKRAVDNKIELHLDGTWYAFDSGYAITDSNWHHVAVSFIRSGLATCYVDGVLYATRDVSAKAASSLTNSYNLLIGRSFRGDNFYSGSIDEVRIWNYARTAEQIRENYRHSIKPQSGLVAYYKLDGNALDSSGNGNHGTVNGGVTWSVDAFAKGSIKLNATSYVNLGTTPCVLGLGAFTVNMWVKYDSFPSSGQSYMFYHQGDGNYADQLTFVVTSDGRISVGLKGNTYTGQVTVPNRWYHVSFTRRADGSGRVVYDGTLVARDVYFQGNWDMKPHDCIIGASVTIVNSVKTITPNLNGNVAGLQVFNKELTMAEIQRWMYESAPVNTPELIEEVRLDSSLKGIKGTNGVAVPSVPFTRDYFRADVSASLSRRKAITTKLKLGSMNTTKTGHVSVNNSSQWDSSRTTIEFYMKFNESTSAQSVAGCSINSTYVNTSSADFMRIALNGSLRALGYTGAVGVWFHLALVFDNGTFTSYVNGVSTSSYSYTPFAFEDGWGFGGFSISTGGRSPLSISDARVWNYARTATQIAENYKRAIRPQAGLVAHYKLNGNALDSSGFGNHGTETNVGYSVAGAVPVSNVAKFDGVSGHIETSFKTPLGSGDFTISVYYNQTSKSTNQTLLGQFPASTSGVIINFTSTYITSQIAGISLPNIPIPNGGWQHLSIVKSSDVIYVYLNGLRQSATPHTNSVSSINPYYIGTYNSSGGIPINFFNGSISSVRIWSKALTQKEILDNMYKVLPASTTGLIEQWTLNGNALGTNGSNGTITGGVTFAPDIPKGEADVSSAVDKSAIMVSKSEKPYALEIAPSNNYLTVGQNGSYLGIDNSSYTIAFWSSAYAKNHAVIGLGNLDGIHYSDNASHLTLRIEGIDYKTAGAIPYNIYEHWAWVYDLPALTLRVYRNGGLMHEWADVTPFVSVSANPVYIGKKGGFTANGLLAGLTVWAKAFTGDELKSSMTKVYQSTGQGLVEQFVPDRNRLIRCLSNQPIVAVKSGGSITTIPSTAPVGQRSTLKFNNNYIDTGIGSGRDLSLNPITIELWAKHTRLDSFVVGAELGSSQRLYLGIPSSGVAPNPVWDIGIRDKIWTNSGITANPNQWYHLAVVLDGSTAVLYVDGISRTTKSYSPYTLASNIYIGGLPSYYKVTGCLSNVRIWDKALTSTEIKSNMHRYLPASTPNLIEQWKLNESVGSTVYGTKGNHGTITGTATWTTPSLMNWKNKVARFDGISQCIMLTKEVVFSKPFTVETWIKVTSFKDFGDVFANNSAIRILTFASGLLEIAIRDGVNSWISAGSKTITANTWYHVSVTYNGIILIGYVDGIPLNSGIPTNIIVPNCIPYIAARNNTSSTANYLDGSIDELRIWNTARTQQEIQDNMYRSLDRHPNLVLNMNFDSTLTYDSSGFGNHGTVVGNVTQDDSDNDKLLFNAPLSGS